MDKIRSKAQYRKMYPKLEKWLNRCIVCQNEGYKPELPEWITPGVLAQNIRKMWDELEVNELSMCNDCEQTMNKK